MASPYCCEPVAIVGMAMRLPGGVRTADDFWNMLINKRTGHCEIPSSRFSIDAFCSEKRPHAVRTKYGNFLHEDPADFDTFFFSIPPYEAARMDPQQRKLLEVVWECLENAGETHWRGKDIGCYVGVFGSDWLCLVDKDHQATDRYYVLGTGNFTLSNRVSYEYDFRGPSMTIETGCSGSMVALHEACQALSSGQCSSAIVAGTNLILSPTMMTSMSENMVISPSGMCRTFDEEADGYGRGEAINALYIKPLSHAIRDNDPIRAVIRATATNSDGKTPIITAPGMNSQKSLIEATYRRAGIENLSQTAYFECHGTGTQAGDEAEVSVVAELFRAKGITIGSVKTNVGHSEGASGVTSIIKSVLCLEQKVIPPTIYQTLHPDIPFAKSNLSVPSEPTSWPQDHLERISVNSFGIGGTNVHAILESYSPNTEVDVEADVASVAHCPNRAELLIVSASTEKSLEERTSAIVEFANKYPEALSDLAYTLRIRREHMANRAFGVVRPDSPIDVSAFKSYKAQDHPVILAFSGQGVQWPGMGKALMKMFVEFRAAIEEMERILQSLPDGPNWSLAEEITKETDSHIHEAHMTQPLCIAFQIALFHVLASLDLKVQCLVGHSSGEIAAAYAAGAITLRCAIILAYYRGVAIGPEQGCGSMFAVSLGSQEISPYLREGVAVACINGPQSVTLSGYIEQLEKTVREIKLQRPEAICKPLKVNVAYHTRQLAHCGRVYESLIAPHIEHPTSHMPPLASVVTCSIIEDPSELGASYWRRHLECPVLFQGAVELIMKAETRPHVVFELGPHPALSAPLKQIWRNQAAGVNHVYIPTITRGDNDPEAQILKAIGLLHSNGVSVNLKPGEFHREGKVLTTVPLYPWQRDKPLWSESRAVREWRQSSMPHHELLGCRVTETSELEPTWRNLLSIYSVAWICDHVLEGSVVFPAAGYIAMAGEAIRQLFPTTKGFTIRNLMLKSAWILEHKKTFEVITSLKPIKYTDVEDSEWYSMSVIVHDGTSWTKHCQGQVRSEDHERQHIEQSNAYIRSVDSKTWYEALSKKGITYGACFRGLKTISADPVAPTATASICDDAPKHDSRYFVHPTAIDQCLQLLSVAQSHGLKRCLTGLGIPASIAEIYIAQGEKEMTVKAALTGGTPQKRLGEATLSTDGRLIVSLRNVFFFSLGDDALYSGSVVPLVAQMKLTKDIDFMPCDELLAGRAQIYSEPRVTGALHGIAKLSILYVLNAAEIMTPIEPCSEHMRKWKEHIMSLARSVDENVFTESRNWASMRLDDRKDLIQKFRESVRDPLPEGWTVMPRLLQKVYDHCRQFLLGTASPLEVLLEENMLESLYTTHSPQQSGVFLYSLGSTKPGIRILEVGAGTGCATFEALKCLQTSDGVRLYSSYTFTDITPGFFAPAAEKFKGYRGLEFKTLDITKPPSEQGFELHSYDLIIASNALHITPNLKTSLQSVHDLLRPNGRLLLHELHPTLWIVDFLMVCTRHFPLFYVNSYSGVFPGWWLGEEIERQCRPYVSPEIWDKELRQAGFIGNEAMVYDNERPLQTNFTMLSRPVECRPTQRSPVHLLHSETQSSWTRGLESFFAQRGYSVTSGVLGEEHPREAFVISLLDFDTPFLYSSTNESFEALRRLIQGVVGGTLLWITHPSQLTCTDPRFGLIHGFSRTIKQEMNIQFTILEIDHFDSAAYTCIQRLIEKISQARQLACVRIDQEYILHQGDVYVGRCHWPVNDTAAPMAEQGETTCKILDISSYGLLDSLNWCDTTLPSLRDDELEVDVSYVGLNFRVRGHNVGFPVLILILPQDLMVAMGLFGDRSQLGFEANGVVRQVGPKVVGIQAGDRIGFTKTGVFATKVVVQQRYCVKIPDGLSLDEAAALLSVYATVFYCFLRLGTLHAGQSVLIHSACGGVGQAAIHVCRALGAKIYATVGNEEKVQYLVDHFGLEKTHIFHSRDESFVADLMRETSGRGVDVVLNSLAGKLLHASWRCVAPFGKMIELGKRDFLMNGVLDMAPFLENRSFIAVDLLQVLKEDPDTWEWLRGEFEGWFKEGIIGSIHPVKIFNAADVTSAFRYLQKGTHIGKIVVRMPSSSEKLPSTRSFAGCRFSARSSYLLVGGLGGLGRSVSSWMVEQGAREIVYLSRSAGQSENDQRFKEELKVQGCEATFVAGSVAVLEDVQKAVATCTKPLAGVMLLSMVLRDQMYVNMSYEEWTTCLEPKVQGAWNLHHAVQNQNLDFFVVFSSISGTNGFAGQTNYSAANSFLASFTKYRRQLRLPSSVLDLGPVEGVGTISTNPKFLNTLRRAAVRVLDEREFIRGLEVAIWQSSITGDSTDPDFYTSNPAMVGLGNNKPIADPTTRTTWRRDDLRFALYANMDLKGSRNEIENNELRIIVDRIKKDLALADDPRTKSLMMFELGRMILPHVSQDSEVAVTQCGNIQIDSLIAIEIKAWVTRVLGVDISLVEVGKAGTIGGLVYLCLELLKAQHAKE
ncbi:fatty acid synthase S-acetyltransferase [Aspergillus homomorphus CBS 101889]|uniref:Fatty acid synthase S-acetyltransferase n=1 Tax=Aspergillus homomorphus (strain CBS 101889) TaxID=1450537 RepID=A0A395HN80_ASPHC|nr:fatty acid synthase S-acetyltransferase [Aspergillus homomorphus CBS 101889]RAL08735.1 fatty acid synthase S-acetyltransferase [Aspergillus homomorphus CBS 101889]